MFKSLLFVLLMLFLACDDVTENQKTKVKEVVGDEKDVTTKVVAEKGAILKLKDGTSIKIAAGAIETDTVISVKKISSNTSINIFLEPEGLYFSKPVEVTIPISENINKDLVQIGIYSDAIEGKKIDNELAKLDFLNPEISENDITVSISHFSQISLKDENAINLIFALPTKYLKMGDIQYHLSPFSGSTGWLPGHAGLYVGTKNPENAMEADESSFREKTFVQSWYNSSSGTFPYAKGVYVENGVDFITKADDRLYMGAKRRKNISWDELKNVAKYALSKEGSFYNWVGNGNPAINGGDVNHFSCVGLVEAAFESVGKGLVIDIPLFNAVIPVHQYYSNELEDVTEITVKEGEVIEFPIYGVARDKKIGWFDTHKKVPVEIISGLPTSATYNINSNLKLSFDTKNMAINSPYKITFKATNDFNLLTYTEDKTLTINVKSNDSNHETGTVTDIDGNAYKTIKIGDQWWMMENLRVTRYRNGDIISNITGDENWTKLATGAFCNYKNDEQYVEAYGRLYNWFAASDVRNIAPEGWHVPSDEDWKKLEIFLGMSSSDSDKKGWSRGNDEAKKIKLAGLEYWDAPNSGATNESGFSAIPAGNRSYQVLASDDNFGSLGYNTTFWTSTENENYPFTRSVNTHNSTIARWNTSKTWGFSIRCVKNSSVINTPPKADFSVDPTSGTTSTIFNFDALTSSDNEDVVSILEVRWDFENDGTWDTNYTTTKTTSHQYSTAGTKTVKLEIKDSSGLTNSTTLTVSVTDGTQETGTMTDIDGNVYKTVKIGNQWWMAENLKVTKYRNGDAIPNVMSNSEWDGLNTGAYAAYNNDNANINTYGLLYNWYAVDDNRLIAPEGWHVATDEEWKELEIHLGMSQGEADDTGSRGTNEGGKLKETGTTVWKIPNTGATNEVGFSGRPGGSRDYLYGTFNNEGDVAGFWSANATNNNNSWSRRLYSNYSVIARYNSNDYRGEGFSVRCVKN